MKRYVLLIAYRQPSDWDMADEKVREEFFAAHHAFEAYVDAHGRRLGSAALADGDTATTIRHLEDVATVTDGPFAETVEMIGGYYDVELPDLDAAITAGKLLPPAYAVEVRPVVAIEGYESA